jgi:DNA-binding transcriptional LysR family regulator
MSDPVETSELLAFSKTVDAKSLSRAAAELGVPRATVSRRLARLEERLGVRLLRRTTRTLALTDAGETLYRHARIALDAVSHAEASVRKIDGAIRGDLRVSVPPMIDPDFFAMLCDFSAQHPEVRLHVHFSSRHVDLRSGGYDVALRASTEIEPGLVARTLVRAPVIAVASPAYLAENGVPRTRRDLRRHRCLMGFARGELPEAHWPLAGGGKLHVEGSFFSNDLQQLCDAAGRGLGIALLPMFLAGPLLESGELVHVLPGIIEADTQVALVYPEREFVPPQVRAFIDAVAAWAPGGLTRQAAARSGPRRRARSGPNHD